MSTIPYAFHWVRKSRDEKKQCRLESHASIPPTTSSIQLKYSFNSLNRLFKRESNHNQEQHIYPNKHDVDFYLKYYHARITPNRVFNGDCIPVEAVKELNCTLGKDDLYHGLFESTCKQHRLCYTCGQIHGITKQKCNTLSRVHMYDLCSKNASLKSDCLKKRFLTLTIFQQDIYRLSDFSNECYDKCILNYLYSIPNSE